MGRDPDILAWGRDMLSDHKAKGGLTSILEEIELINDELEQAELSSVCGLNKKPNVFRLKI